MRIPIRSMGSGEKIPPRVFDLEIEGDNVDIVVKLNKDKYEKVPWQLVEYQVRLAIEKNSKK